jgi:7-carboxy-7-deazaguanine synthase
MLRVVEVYSSYQGEGPNTSKPTVFVRFAGCNFKCPGWPCDTQHAIDPKIFSKTQKFKTPIDLADQVLRFGVDNICLTGGEVFLQNNDELRDFINALKVSNEMATVEVFTNGSLPWGEDIPLLVDNFILDWKLPGSGENYANVGDAFDNNFENLNVLDAVKFTINDRNDYEVAKARYENDIKGIDNEPMVYAGIVWDSKMMTTEVLCAWMQRDMLPWRLNVQTHKFVWNPNKIGV